jgi:hypothetical protein
MTTTNLNKLTVNYTKEDKVQIVKSQILDWWLVTYHKKTLRKIEKIARDHIKETESES